MYNIEVIEKKGKKFAKVDGRAWNTKGRIQDYGDLIIEILWYVNKTNSQIQVLINGVNETEAFRKQVIERYTGGPFAYFLNHIGKA